MFCPKCGKEVGEGQAFCPSCGAAQTKNGQKTSELRSSIPTTILDNLPLAVKTELAKMPLEKQNVFLEEYRRKEKSIGLAYVLWFVIGLHYIYLSKWGLQFFYWVTWGGFFIWALIDLFRIPSMVRGYNKDKAIDVLRDLKIISLS